MPNTIDVHRYTSFEDTLKYKLQQKESKLLKLVDTTTVSGKIEFRDFLGEVGFFDKNTGRHSRTKLSQIDHNRRAINCNEFAKSFMVDNKDQNRNLHSLSSGYIKAAHMAYNRSIDKLIYDGIEEEVQAGEDGKARITRPTTNDIAFDGFYDANGVWQASGGTLHGLTIDKLRRAKLMLDENYADEIGKYYMIVHPRMLDQMLGNVEVTSADYNTVKALVNGEVNSFMGFEFIAYNGVRKDDVTSIYDCYAICQGAMLLGTQNGGNGASGGELRVMKATRPDLNFSQQISMYYDKGVARMYDEGIIKVECKG